MHYWWLYDIQIVVNLVRGMLLLVFQVYYQLYVVVYCET